ncbi:MAG: STAS domain-containing protein [Bacteroidota bacterium]
MNFNFEAKSDKIGVFYLEGNLIGEHDGMPLTDAFNEQMENGILNFALNLSDLKHINSSGLGVFITLLTKARKKGGELVLVGPSDYIRNLMLITKLNSIFTIFPTIDSAVEALGQNDQS